MWLVPKVAVLEYMEPMNVCKAQNYHRVEIFGWLVVFAGVGNCKYVCEYFILFLQRCLQLQIFQHQYIA